MARGLLVALGIATGARAAEVDVQLALALAQEHVGGPPSEVDLELVLAVDASGSLSGRELAAQREGYVAAFRHPELIRAVRSGPLGRIAVTYVEWGGEFDQTVVVPWMVIASGRHAELFAQTLEAAPLCPQFTSPPRLTGTSLSAALTFSAALIAGNGLDGIRAIIDISGNGANNSGDPIGEARAAVVGQGVTVNGLPLALRSDGFPIEAYYEDCVIGGVGAFLLTVPHPDLLEESIRRKLILEVANLPAPHMPAAVHAARPPVDCATDGQANWWRHSK